MIQQAFHELPEQILNEGELLARMTACDTFSFHRCAATLCKWLIQDTAPPARLTTVPKVERNLSLSPTQSVSV
jgi:hypothetical protein